MQQFSFTRRARPIVQIGIGDARVATTAGTWGSAIWGDSVWSGIEPHWLDVTCDVNSMRCELGRARTADRYVYSSATVRVDNSSGWADPFGVAAEMWRDENGNLIADQDGNLIALSEGGYGVLMMRPGRAIRFGIDHADLGVVWLFRGFIDEISPTYHPVDHDVVEFQCIDALGELNRIKLLDLPYTVGAYDAVTTRLSRILDRAEWPEAKRDLAPAGGALIPHALGGQVADLLGQTSDSVGGFLFGDTEGNIVFRSRQSILFEPGTEPDATIGNGAGDVCPVRWTRPFARADVTTRVILGRDSETAIQVDDVDAQRIYGIEPFERTDLLTAHDGRLEALAREHLATRGVQTAPRIRSVMLDAATAPASLDLQTSVRVLTDPSRFRCRHTLPRGEVFDAEHFATGVMHDITPHEWVTEIMLDSAAPWAVSGGRWDEALWGQAVWA